MLPHHYRQDLFAPRHSPTKAPDEQRLQEFQSLLEDSLLCGTVITVLTEGGAAPATTGIVQSMDPSSGHIEMATLEGTRKIEATRIKQIVHHPDSHRSTSEGGVRTKKTV
jgi:hypothetical protein